MSGVKIIEMALCGGVAIYSSSHPHYYQQAFYRAYVCECCKFKVSCKDQGQTAESMNQASKTRNSLQGVSFQICFTSFSYLLASCLNNGFSWL